ncbi:MAG: Flp pilus assembly protein CpaB [bacterium]
MKRIFSLKTFMFVGGVAAAFLTVFMMTRYLNLRESQIAAALRDKLAREGFTTLAVAELEIAPGMTVTSKDVKIAPWPKKAVLKGAFHDSKNVVGRAAARRIIAGEPILEGHLIPKGGGTGLAAIIPKGRRAVAVRVNEIIGVAGFIKPGDLVDVIVTMEPMKGEGVITKTVLQRVPVLAVGQEITRENGRPNHASAVTLWVGPADAEKLALASRNDIQLAMRNTLDASPVITKGSTPVRLVGWTPPKPKPKVEPASGPSLPPPVTGELIRGSTRGIEHF